MRRASPRSVRSDYLQSMRLWTNFFAGNGAEVAAIAELFDWQEKTVLDVGCGNGRLSIKLAESALSVTGIDLDARLLDFARTYAESNDVKHLSFLEMSAMDLNFADSSFDLVIMPWMLHMLKDRYKAVQEAHRVLRPGGRLIIFGLWADCDYDRIAHHFVSRREEEIEPRTFYEGPLQEAFGSFEWRTLPADRSFSFIFPDCGVTVEAFFFAFQNWYDKTMTERELKYLRHLLPAYRLGNHIELRTRGAIYTSVKAGEKEQKS